MTTEISMCRIFSRQTSKRFYAEFLCHDGEQEISPIWAKDHDEAVTLAKAECVGRSMNFVSVEKTWDAFTEHGFITPRHVMEAPDGNLMVGDKVYWRGPVGQAPPVVVVVKQIILERTSMESASWRDVRWRGILRLDNGYANAYGWQIEPVPAAVLVIP